MRKTLSAAVLALVGITTGTLATYLFERFPFAQNLQNAAISEGPAIAQAECTPADPQGDTNDIFFISCGGIY